MKRIAIDARIISTSTGRYVERLLHHLQKTDTDNQYVVLMLKKDLGYWRPSAPNFKVVAADFPLYSFREQFQFALLLYRLKVDLVHFTMPSHPLAYFKKHVITVHDLTLVAYVNRRREGQLKDLYRNHLKPAVFRAVLSVGVRCGSHIITPTKYVMNAIHNHYGIPRSRISFTHEAAEKLAAAPVEPSPPIHRPFILYVGNAYPYKNLERLVMAAAEVNRTHPITLVLAGKSDYFYEALKTYVTKSHIGNVRFTGFVSDAELVWLYQHATLYVFPSLSEGFGLPPLEAMSYGLPVAAAKTSCLPEVLDKAAIYFDPLDTAAMTQVITDTLNDPEKLAGLKKAGLDHAKLFSWKRMAQQTHEIYTKVLI
ncbi:MAG TPA: glycosyltransferase family 1 protein [Candidatus Polarisedimenticolaceae bacterium]|nr:glycosyltransferase family 1 protein [Candidatus Polarisedimenticolaceae bacterium]